MFKMIVQNSIIFCITILVFLEVPIFTSNLIPWNIAKVTLHNTHVIDI